VADQALQNTVHQWMPRKWCDFYRVGIQVLVQKWEKADDYTKKELYSQQYLVMFCEIFKCVTWKQHEIKTGGTIF
jgi:hypothetical protein